MSERVLHEWTDSESIIRIVEDDRGFFGWSAESGIVTDLIPIVFCKELARLAARVSELEADIQLITAPAESTGGVFLALKSRISELELDREGRVRSSDYDKARIEELEAENTYLAASQKTLVAEREELEAENERLRDEVDRQTKAKECYEERQARKEAENAKLRKCVKEADAMREEITCPNTWDKEPAENCCDACWSMIHYDAARAEVDK